MNKKALAAGAVLLLLLFVGVRRLFFPPPKPKPAYVPGSAMPIYRPEPTHVSAPEPDPQFGDRPDPASMIRSNSELAAAQNLVPAAPAPAPAPAAPAVPPAKAELAGDAASLSALGVTADSKGLSQLGLKDELLQGAMRKLLEHPKVLGFMMNNTLVVNAFFSRSDVREMCSSAAAQKAYLMDTRKPDGISAWLPLATDALKRPEAAEAWADSEIGKRLTHCPSVQQLSKDPVALLQIGTANAGVMGLVSNPASAQVLSKNPDAMSMLQSAQSSMLGGVGH